MKKTLSLVMLMTLGQDLWAQNDKQNGNQRVQESYADKCLKKELGEKKSARQSNPALPLSQCEDHLVIAVIDGQAMNTPMDTKTTADGKVTCRRDGGYTVDFNDCKRVAQLYDGVLMAEQAMITAQGVQINEANKTAAAKLEKRVAEGDAHNGAVDAAKDRNQLNKNIYNNQIRTYTVAVGALGAQISRWRGHKQVEKECARVDRLAQAADAIGKKTGLTPAECSKVLARSIESSVVFANSDAKGQFLAATAAFVQKAKVAMDKAGISEEEGKYLDKVADLNDDEDLMLEKCLVTPEAAECKGASGRTAGAAGTFKGNSVQFGATGANQGFDFNSGDNSLGGGSDPTAATDETTNVTGATSPFEAAAKEAKGILNPAAAATIGAGEQASAPGGGGAGGGGGGGSASLGDDLEGAEGESNKDPDIETKKYGGNYKGGKAAGFQPLAKSKDEGNPFASLFDAKGEAGGIEEDTSISADTGAGASGLFEKISKRYSQVQQEKRIETQNVE